MQRDMNRNKRGSSPLGDQIIELNDNRTTTSNKTPPQSRIPTRHLDRQWSACSLCSVDSIELDEQLPIPGRESHTSDMNQFLTYIHRLNRIQREKGDLPLNVGFWKFFMSVLDTAKEPVGYMGVTDCDAVETKSAQDNAAFLRKVDSTSIINPIYPGVVAEKLGLDIDVVLTELLYAAKIDMVRMKWFPDCELLGTGDTCASKRPRKKKSTYCNGCKYSNAIAVLDKIKVVFLFNTDIFFAMAENHGTSNIAEEKNDVLAVVPATFTGSGYRYSLGCGGEHQLRPALDPGRYKIECPMTIETCSFLRVERTATANDAPHVLRIHVSDILHRTGRSRKMLSAPHGKIHLDVFTDTHPFFICRMNKVDDDDDDDDGRNEGGCRGGGGTGTPPATCACQKASFTSAKKVMDNSAYLNLFECTEDETFHFNSAVKKMSLEATLSGTSTGEEKLIAPMKTMSVFNDEIASVAEDE